MAGVTLKREALDASEARPENTWYLRVVAVSSEPGLDSAIFVYHVHDQTSGYSGDVFETVASILQMQDIDVGSFTFGVKNIGSTGNGQYEYLGLLDASDTPVYKRVGDTVDLDESTETGFTGNGTVFILQEVDDAYNWICKTCSDWEDEEAVVTTIVESDKLFTSVTAARLPDDQLVTWGEDTPVFYGQRFTTGESENPFYRRDVLECFFVSAEELEDAWTIILEDTRNLVMSSRVQLQAEEELEETIDP